MVTFSIRDEIVEVINKLFVYTDRQEWEKLQNEVFSDDVFFDMSSLGGQKAETTSKEICETWKNGFVGIDSINHLAGNYLVQIHDTTATVFAYATATHYKESATKGKTREFVGTYDISLMKHGIGWRIYQFKYDLKYATGNIDLS
ncbi:MAG: nuclear transport factor 2 family protein [Chitinophagaceae bacterium]|nr:nuclear transport factor 2 family protein [Chitinophagaceae bacterium]